jgi:hypothetical protein
MSAGYFLASYSRVKDQLYYLLIEVLIMGSFMLILLLSDVYKKTELFTNERLNLSGSFPND